MIEECMSDLDSLRPLKGHTKSYEYIDKDTKIVISFDGGGIRGLISMMIADALEKACGVQLCQACDLMIGTSTGGINALWLTAPDKDNPKICRYSAHEIVHEYRKFSAKTFTHSLSHSLKSLWGAEKYKYKVDGLKQSLSVLFEDITLSEAVTRSVVITAAIEMYVPMLLKSYEGPNFFMRDAALATSAAPSFFPIAQIKPVIRQNDRYVHDKSSENFYMIDGKLTGTNNPALAGYAEICKIFKNIDDIREKVIVISIGTGKTHRTIHYDEVSEGGALAWLPFLMPLMGELADDMTDYQMDILLQDLPQKTGGSFRRYWRFQPTIPQDSLLFDEYNEIKMKDMVNATKSYILDHAREIHDLGIILAKRAEYLKRDQAESK
jgi:patatin-like phospholipase/acyl hydrolase